MHNLLAVGKPYGVANLLESAEQVRESILAYGVFVAASQIVEHLFQRGAPDELHCVKGLAVFIRPQCVHGNDVWMFKLSGDAGLVEVALGLRQ